MLIDRNHRITGTLKAERNIRFSRPAFLVESVEQFRAVVRGACALSGGRFCHLIPVEADLLTQEWLDYLWRVCPDAIFVPKGREDLKKQLDQAHLRRAFETDYSLDVSWAGSPYIHSFLEDRRPDGSPAACGPTWLVDAQLEPTPPISTLQSISRFGLVPVLPVDTLRNLVGVFHQLSELVPTVPPHGNQPLTDWLFGDLSPDTNATTTPAYLAGGATIHSPISLNHTKIWAGSQTFPPHDGDSAWSLSNRLVVVGNGESLPDACLFWNLRANRWSYRLPIWVTPEQLQLPEVRAGIVGAALRTSKSPGWGEDGVDDLHFVSATLDTQEIARTFTGSAAIGWGSSDWLNFIDRRSQPFYQRSKEVVSFTDGYASLVLNESSLPVSKPTQVTIDLRVDAFRPPRAGVRLTGNVQHIGRFGEAIFVLNFWRGSDFSVEASVGYPRTFEFIKAACERAGLRPSFDRKAALTFGLKRLLGDEWGTHMVLRNHDVLRALMVMVKAETVTDEGTRRLTPLGVSFGEIHKTLADQQIATALISWLLKKGLIFRGLELTCPECGTQAWYSLDEIGNLFECVGCRAAQPFDRMPNDAPWRYRINQLLASALDQGVLQGILTAHDLQVWETFGSTAYLLPNVILSDATTGRQVIEFDLLGFMDGEWIAAECKAWGDVSAYELHALRRTLDRMGGGELLLVRASTASPDCDGLVDRVRLWDHQPIRQQAVRKDELLNFLSPDRI